MTFRDRVEAVMKQSIDIFGDQASARQWWLTTTVFLGMRRPIDVVGTEEGLVQVEQYLGRIETGVYV